VAKASAVMLKPTRAHVAKASAVMLKPTRAHVAKASAVVLTPTKAHVVKVHVVKAAAVMLKPMKAHAAKASVVKAAAVTPSPTKAHVVKAAAVTLKPMKAHAVKVHVVKAAAVTPSPTKAHVVKASVAEPNSLNKMLPVSHLNGDTLRGAGLGLRRAFLRDFVATSDNAANFFEIAPENWIHMGGKFSGLLDQAAEQMPMVCHGLSLNLGGQAPLDTELILEIRDFLHRYHAVCYSEHLSYCADDGHLYDLLPIPFTEQAINHVSDRIKQAQDLLGQPIAVENASYYCAPGQQMPEIDFLLAVLEQADCGLLLDINNIYVNSINHQYDALDFLRQLPTKRITYGHIAGHYRESATLLVDTHGSNVIDPVWDLLHEAYAIHGVYPTLLERDFNIPALSELQLELQRILAIQQTQSERDKLATGVGG